MWDGYTSTYQLKEEKSYKAPIINRKISINCVDKTKIKDKIMFLTFDDGPLLGSDNIITILQEENVKATMFMVGKHIKKSKYNKKTFNRAVEEPLVLVANHTYTHANGRYREFYSDKLRLLLDIQQMDDYLTVEDKNHYFPYCRLAGRNVFRLPDIYIDDPGIPAKYKEKDKYDALWYLGYYIYGWDYQWSYNPNNGKVIYSPDKIVRNIERIYKRGKVKNRGKFVLLMHDFSFRDKFDGQNQLRTLIKKLKTNGWRFEAIDTYL